MANVYRFIHEDSDSDNNIDVLATSFTEAVEKYNAYISSGPENNPDDDVESIRVISRDIIITEKPNGDEAT